MMVNKKILLVVIGLLLLSTLTSARRLHLEGEATPAAPAEGADAKPAADAKPTGDKPAEGAADKSAEGGAGKSADKPAEGGDKPTDKPAEGGDKPADKPAEGGDKPAQGSDKPADRSADKPAEGGDKPAAPPGGDGARVSSVEFCGCEGAIAVTGDKLTLNISSFHIQKGEFSLPAVNWTNFKAPPAACKDGYFKRTPDGVCEPADAILMQDLDAPNLISSEPIPSLRKKQQAFFRANPTFRPIYCEEKVPYVSKPLICVACEAPKQYWSLDTLECVACPEGQVYNAQERRCVPKPVDKTPLTNLDAGSFLTGPGEDLEKYKKAQEEEKSKNPNTYVCDLNTPYVINGVCSVCPKDSPLFYLPSGKCVKCKAGSYYDSKSLSCIAADPRMNIPIKTPNLLVDALALSESQGNFYLQHPDFRPIVCDANTPFYNGDKCIACTAPTELFNVTSLTCDSCKAGEIYIPRRRACKPINSLLLLDLDAPNLLLPFGVTIDQLKDRQNSFIQQHPTFTPHKCDKDRPYFNGEVCVSCQEPTPLFNVSSLVCTACPENSKYDADTRQCTMLTKTNRYYTNVKALKYILLCDETNLDQVRKDIENEKEGAKNQPLITLEECPEETPFSVGGKCIACGGDNPYFDYCLKKCGRCAEGEDFNPETQTCTTEAGGFYTDLSSRFLIVSGNKTFDEVANQIKSKITKRMIECPKTAPFFDGKSCIDCQAPLQYFDLVQNHCIGCFQGTFNPQERKCEQEEIVNPLEGKFKEITKSNRSKIVKNVTEEVVDPLEGKFKETTKAAQQKGEKTETSEIVNPVEGKAKNQTASNETGSETGSAEKNETSEETTSKNETVGETAITGETATGDNNQTGGETETAEKSETSNKNETSSQTATGVKTGSETTESASRDIFTSNLENEQWVAPNGWAKLRQYFENKSTKKSRFCDLDKPFWNGQECISCPKDQYYSFRKKTCVTVPEGKVFDANIHKFVRPIKNRITDESAERIDFAGNSANDIKQRFEAMRNKVPKPTVCPSDKPYYDGITCINCEEPYPIFNIETLKCTKCNRGQLWSEKDHSCIDDEDRGKSAWTIVKGLGSILAKKHTSNQQH